MSSGPVVPPFWRRTLCICFPLKNKNRRPNIEKNFLSLLEEALASLPNTWTPVVHSPAAPEGTQFPPSLSFQSPHLLPLWSVLSALLLAGNSHVVTTFSMISPPVLADSVGAKAEMWNQRFSHQLVLKFFGPETHLGAVFRRRVLWKSFWLEMGPCCYVAVPKSLLRFGFIWVFLHLVPWTHTSSCSKYGQGCPKYSNFRVPNDN